MKKTLNIISLVISVGLIVAFTIALIIFLPQYQKYTPRDYLPLNVCYDNVKIVDTVNNNHTLSIDIHNLSQKEQIIKIVIYINEIDVLYREMTLPGDDMAMSTTYFFSTTYSSSVPSNGGHGIEIFFANEKITGKNILTGETIVKRPTNGATLQQFLWENSTQFKKTVGLASGLSDNWITSFDYNMLICYIMLGTSIVLTGINTTLLVLNLRKRAKGV